MLNTKYRTVVAASVAIVAAIFCWWRMGQGAVAAEVGAAGPSWSNSRLWVIRLRPGDDLADSIMDFSRRHSIRAGGIVTCVGSLSKARLRYANQKDYAELNEKGRHFEIVSLVGTFSTTDRHLHLAVANEKGQVFGGHASSGNKVYTTAEIILIEGVNWEFRRENDVQTQYFELSPVQITAPGSSNTK
jgi:predicted DNA-binding protein with PD1-like motif